jgi:hypothetical protein
LDTGCELCVINQDLYNELRNNGTKNLELPVQNMKLVSAFSDKARKVETPAMLILKFGGVRVDQIFLIAPRLITQVLIDVDFRVASKVIFSFPYKCFTCTWENTTHVGRYKRNAVEIYVTVRGAISYFKNIFSFSLLAKG